MSTPASSPSSADRNLLFGILALQLNFVSRDALVSAMNAWMLQKATPLGNILLAQGALAADAHTLLEALVQKHLEMHGGDAQKSLASVSSLGSARQQLEQIADAELHQSLAHVAAPRTDEDDPLLTRPPTAGEPTSVGQRFRILRPHARGGLGEVFVAHDAELGREVALKEIQNRFADDRNSRSRFVLEAEITGGLEHPGIVPVYGLGQYADGRPFYAMRFIRGDSLQDAIRRFHEADVPGLDAGERSLSLRQLLGRFVDVCDAIDYAHSRGVLHRDLKPGNIMLGKYGETLVVDWGLAKPLGCLDGAIEAHEGPLQPSSAGDATPTRQGATLGTPGYMAPEQAAGRLDLLGPASDVYSLGATLYCLLTGPPPFKGKDAGEILRRVQQGEFAPPRSLKSATPAALEAVCLKAMALKPEDRYSSARLLARDIEHWLADEPVSAWREPWGLRVRRWVGRHRTLVTTAAATLLVATVSLTAATILLQAANSRERQAKEMAEEQKRETEKQAAIALAVNDFLQKDLLGQADISQQIVGAREERDPDVKVRTLLDRASRSIEGKFKNQPLTEAAIRQTIGDAYGALGRYAESQRHLESSLRLRAATLGADHPHTLTSKNNLAMLYQAQGKYDFAEPIFKEVLHARTIKLGADHLDTLDSKNNLALLYKDRGKYDLAEPLYKEVLQTRTAKLGADHSHTLMSKNNLAMLYHAQSRYDLAEPLLKEALQAWTAKLGADHPHTLSSKNNLAWFYHAQGKYDLAEPLYKEVLQTRTAKLGADHPDTVRSKNNLALLYKDQGKYDLAELLLKEALQAWTAKLGADHPHTLASKNNLASLFQAQRKYDLAEPIFKEVLRALTAKLGADHPDTVRSKNNLAMLYHAQSRYDLAEPLLKEALQAWTAKLGADHPHTLVAMSNLGVNYRDAGRTKDAIPLFEEALQCARKRPDGLPAQIAGLPSALAETYDRVELFDKSEPLYRAFLDETRKQYSDDHSKTAEQMGPLGYNLLRQKKYADAEPILRDCLAIREKKEADLWSTFNTRSMLGEVLAGQKKYAEAEPLLLQGYEGMKQREKSIPPQGKVRLREGLERIVRLYDAWGKKDKGDEYRKKLAAEQAKPPPAKK